MVRDHSALIALVDARMRAPLAWGEHDCVLFAAAAVKAQTGIDVRTRLGCTWRSAKGAHRLLKARGGLAQATDTVLRRIPLAQAARGDIVMVHTAGQDSLAIVEGALVVAPGLTGLVRLPRALAQIAWSAECEA